ncbi:MAG TPA: GTP cyclohydrolase II [Candidatus Acidoferrum sp.]
MKLPIFDGVRQVASADCPTRWGNFRIFGFQRLFGARETAIALLMGDVNYDPPLTRIHSQCFTGDVLGSLRCDCGQQLELALSMIAGQRAGILIYEAQEGRGIGLLAKLRAYELQDTGYDTVEANERLGLKADYRDYRLPAAILRQFGIGKVRLLTNNPDKVSALESAGIEVVERVPCEVAPCRENANYLKVKKEKLDHLLTVG